MFSIVTHSKLSFILNYNMLCIVLYCSILYAHIYMFYVIVIDAWQGP